MDHTREGPGEGRSAIGRMARSVFAGAREGWDATPPAARRRFFVRLGIALFLVVAVSVASAVLLATVAVDGRLPGDAPVDAWVEGVLGIHASLWLGAFTSSAMVTPLLLLVVVLAGRAGNWQRAVLAILTYVASKGIIMGGWLTWERARPGDVAGGVLIPEGMSSYPSGHTVQALTVYGLLALWWAAATDRRWERLLAWTLVLVGTAAVGAGRVRIGAHYPSDVLGGAALGALWVLGAAWAERAIPPRSPEAGTEA